MSKAAQFFESIKDTVQAIAPGLSADKILGDIGSELKQMGSHGAHETAAALFNGSAFVMYPRAGQEQSQETQQGQQIEAMKQPEVQPEQDKGMGM